MTWGRRYFAAQALAGAAWWVAVAFSPFVREATLGGLDPVVVAVLDIPLFVIASAVAAAGCSLLALSLMVRGRIPTEWIIAGPFAFRPAAPRSTALVHVVSTFAQIVVFWGFFLVVLPIVVSWLERRWAVGVEWPWSASIVGVVVLVSACALIGSLLWNYAVRPLEEADLGERFGDDYRRYRASVRCWVPRIPTPAG